MLFRTEEADSPGLTPRRSLIALAALVSGFLLARYLPFLPSTIGFSTAGILCSIAMVSRAWTCRIALTLAVAAFGFGYFTIRVLEPARSSLLNHLSGSGAQLVKLEGTILDTPRFTHPPADPLNPFMHSESSLHFSLAATRLLTDDGAPAVTGTLWARIAGADQSNLHAGDRVRLTGLLEPFNPPMNPGEPDRRLFGAQDGRIGWLRMSGPGLIEPQLEPETLPEVVASTWLRTRAWLSDRAHTILLGDAPKLRGRDSPDPGRAVLGALILGDEDRSLKEARGSFNRLGLAHILSISGFHLAVMVGVVLFLVALPRDPGRIGPLITAALVLIYLAILPFNAPVWRSGLMVLGLLLADALGRRYDRLTLLGWIAFLLLLYRPLDAWSIGFQLSFSLVALLIWQGQAFHGRLFGIKLKGTIPDPEPGFTGWVVESFKKLTSTSILCGLAATPIVAYHTGLISPAAILTSIILVPIFGALLIAGYIVLLIGVIIPPLSSPATSMLGVLADWVTSLVTWFDALPGTSLRIPSISLALTLFATLAILYWIVRGYIRDRLAWTLATIASAWTIAEFRLSPTLPSATLIRIDTLAVGDGTCHLLRSGRDAMLWDCGSLSPGIGQSLVPRAARALGAYRIPTVLVTHPNLDHFNGILDAAEPLGIKLLITGQAVADRAASHPHSGEAYLLSELTRRGIEVQIARAGDRIELGDCTLEVISPAAAATFTTDNDWSLVARIIPRDGAHDGATPILLCGDIEAPAMDAIRASHPGLHPTVMEAPHHGSAKEAGIQFISALDPRIVLQSTGPQRQNDPRWSAVRGARQWFCTSLNGASWVELKRDGSVAAGSIND